MLRRCAVGAYRQNGCGLGKDRGRHYGAAHGHGSGSEHACAAADVVISIWQPVWHCHDTAWAACATDKTGCRPGAEGCGGWITGKPQQQAAFVLGASPCSNIRWSMNPSLSAWRVCQSPSHPPAGMHRSLRLGAARRTRANRHTVIYRCAIEAQSDDPDVRHSVCATVSAL